MTIKVKRAGAWSTVPNGRLSVKAAGAWYKPGKVHRKMGAYGGGYWTDSGYRGPPLPPAGFYLTNWSYTKADSAWSNPGGTVGVAQYHFEVCNESGVPFWGWYTTSTSWVLPAGYDLAQDTRYIFRVRSISAEGVGSDTNYSPWFPPNSSGVHQGWAYVRFGIGHQATYGNQLFVRERNYMRSSAIPTGYADTSCYINHPARVRIDYIKIFFKASWGAGWLSLPDQLRRIYPIRNADIKWGEPYTINVDPAYYYNLPSVPEWVTNGQFGVFVWGPGWSTPGGPYYITGSFEHYGVEQYDEYRVVETSPATGNYYW